MSLEVNDDVSVDLQRGDNDVRDPKRQEEDSGEVLGSVGASELRLAEDAKEATEHQKADAQDGSDRVKEDAEAESARRDVEDGALCCVVDGCDNPWESKTEEYVDGVGSGDVPDGVVGVAFGDGRGLGGEGVGERGAEGHEGDGGNWIL